MLQNMLRVSDLNYRYRNWAVFWAGWTGLLTEDAATRPTFHLFWRRDIPENVLFWEILEVAICCDKIASSEVLRQSACTVRRMAARKFQENAMCCVANANKSASRRDITGDKPTHDVKFPTKSTFCERASSVRRTCSKIYLWLYVRRFVFTKVAETIFDHVLSQFQAKVLKHNLTVVLRNQKENWLLFLWRGLPAWLARSRARRDGSFPRINTRGHMAG